jgi:undecaprenyl-diphosphatase
VLAPAVSFVSGYLAIAWLLRFLAARSLVPFAVYRLALAGALAALLAGGTLRAVS